MFLSIDHIGVAVSNIEEATKEYVEKFGFTVVEREELKDRGIKVVFLSLIGETTIELLGSTDTSSVIEQHLQKRGPGLHHICYRVKNIELELKRLKSDGYQLIDEVPRSGALGSKIAFIHPKSCGGILTELCER